MAKQKTDSGYTPFTTTAGNGATPKKTECPLSLKEFADNAKQLLLVIQGENQKEVDLILDPKDFSTGSFGWGTSGKFMLKVGDKMVKLQGSINLTIIGSKEAPRS